MQDSKHTTSSVGFVVRNNYIVRFSWIAFGERKRD